MAFNSDRLQKLLAQTAEAEKPPPPPAVVSSPSPSASPPPGSDSSSSVRGSPRGGGRGGRNPGPNANGAGGRKEASNRPESASQRGNRGGRGGGRGGANQRGGGSAPASSGDQPAGEADPTSPDGSARGRGGRGGKQRGGGGGRGGVKFAAGGAADSSSPTAAAAEPIDPAVAAERAAAAAEEKKQRQIAASKAKADAKAAAEAKLDDPENPVNIPSASLQTELTQVARRYNKSFQREQTRSTIRCQWSFAPTDPQFPFALPPEALVIQVTFQDVSLYPYAALPEASPVNARQIERQKQRVQWKVLNQEKDVPRFMREVVESSLNQFIYSSQLGHPQMLRNTLKMLDRELLDWLLLAQKKHDAQVKATIAKLTGGAAAAAAAAAASSSSSTAAEAVAAKPNDMVVAPAATPASATRPIFEVTAPKVATSASTASSASLVAPTPMSALAASPSPALPSSSPVKSASPEEDVWTSAQQTALENGLKEVPKNLPPTERWEKIAERVEGKTRKQVLDRYKSIRDAVKNATLDAVKVVDAVATAPLAVASASAAAPAPSTAVVSAPAPLLGPFGTPISQLSNAQEVDLEFTESYHAARVRAQLIERELERLQEEEDKEEREKEDKLKKKKKQPKQPKEERKGTGGTDGEEEDDDEDGDEGADEMGEFVATTERMSLNPQHRGTQILVDDLEMTGMGIIKASCLRVQLLCVRCESRVDMEFHPSNGVSNPATERCQRCGVTISIAYRPEMLHEHSDSLGYVDLENGELFDMLPSDFFATCLECFTEHPLKQLQRASHQEANCRHCHTKLACRIGQFEFNRIQPARINYDSEPVGDTRGKKAAAAIDPREVAAAKNRKKEQALLKVGTALPNKGSCSHYKRSYRWLRFPCCGKAYPCDTCHNESEDHSGVWATRMICGACSKEQPFSSKPCTNCALAFSSVAKTFWEGGSGMRDRTRLSRNDSKKHANLQKTTSMKATRVGKKAGADKPKKPESKGNNTG